jgi:predicted alpha/beta hydrolase
METHSHGQHDAEPEGRGLQITASDGVTLQATLYEPRTGEARGNVLIIGAVAVPQRFYARFALHLARAGLRVLSVDYRGVGRSRPARLRGYRAELSDWAERDYPAALAFLLQHYGHVPTYAVGHSLGGQVVALSPDAGVLRAVVTVASQNGYAGNFPDAPSKRRLWNTYVPALTSLFGYLPGWAGLGTDLPEGAARQWARWCLSPDYFLSEHPEYGQTIARFARPILAYSFDDDGYAPLVNVRWLHGVYAAAPVEHRHLAARELGLDFVGHFGFFRPSARPLWDEVLRFFDADGALAPTYRHVRAA